MLYSVYFTAETLYNIHFNYMYLFNITLYYDATNRCGLEFVILLFQYQVWLIKVVFLK